jgi:hypothetical protein
MYASINGPVGTPQASLAIGAVNANPPLTPPGQILELVDPWWGAAEMIYARAGGAIRAQGLCSLLPSFQTNQFRFDATEVPNTANLGRMLAVAIAPMVLGDYGWFVVSGIVPVNSSAAVAVDTAIGIAAAGQAGANTAGKQILNARTVAASTTTVIKAGATAPSGSNRLTVGNTDGWFPGIYLSGTGIAAATTVVSVDPSGRIVTLSANTTAAVNGNVTGTYNNATVFYNVVHLNRSFAQGAIT